MRSSDDLSARDASSIALVPAERLRELRAHIAADLTWGRDAWPAVDWLAATADVDAKLRVISELERVLAGASSSFLATDAAATNVASSAVFGRAAQERRRMGRAFEFCAALRASLPDAPTPKPIDPAFDRSVRRQQNAAVASERRVDALQRMGGEPGRGVPFWELYMRRRNKKSWGG